MQYIRTSLDVAVKAGAEHQYGRFVLLALQTSAVPTKMKGWSGSSTACLGNGACATFPVVSMISSCCRGCDERRERGRRNCNCARSARIDESHSKRLEFEAALQFGLVSVSGQLGSPTSQVPVLGMVTKSHPMADYEAGQIVGFRTARFRLIPKTPSLVCDFNATHCVG